jgi:hypothetical protein
MVKRNTAKVQIGRKTYVFGGWTREDIIYYCGKPVGKISVTNQNKAGITASLKSQKTHPGRAIRWCVDQIKNGQPKKTSPVLNTGRMGYVGLIHLLKK